MTSLPIPMSHVSRRMMDDVTSRGLGPERWEVRFGSGALERLGREVRRVAVDRLWDLPVMLPEEPGPVADAVELLLVCDGGGSRQYFSAAMLADSM